jgi:serine protease Do
MKTLLRAGLLALPLLAPAGHAAVAPAPKAPETPRTMPTLVVDAAPIAKTPVVTSYADALESAQQAVVTVYISKKPSADNALARQLFGDALPGRPNLEESGLGSGIIVSADGYILTNNHVVNGADKIEVSRVGDQRIKATLIGTDPTTDIAVIKIEGEGLPVMTLADSDKLRVGDVVFAIGNPLGVGQTVTMGIVSAKGRQIGLLKGQESNGQESKGLEDFIQTDAAINMGNSGGALVDAKGRLVGINSAILSTGRGEQGGSIGIGFSVPVNLATHVMENLVRNGKVSRGYLGIDADDLAPDLIGAFKLPPNAKGVVVIVVENDTPAAKAGLKVDDVVVAIDDKAVTSRAELGLAIAQKSPDSLVKVRFYRQGKEDTVDVTLANFEEDMGRPNELLPGVTVAGLTTDSRRKLHLDAAVEGLQITAVSDASDFGTKLKEGMVVTRINDDQVTDLAKARKSLHKGINRFYVQYSGRTTVIGIEVK